MDRELMKDSLNLMAAVKEKKSASFTSASSTPFITGIHNKSYATGLRLQCTMHNTVLAHKLPEVC